VFYRKFAADVLVIDVMGLTPMPLHPGFASTARVNLKEARIAPGQSRFLTVNPEIVVRQHPSFPIRYPEG
jgi:hypothetical protein